MQPATVTAITPDDPDLDDRLQERWVGVLFTLLAVVLGAAFWMLCQNQVREAEARHASRQEDAMAIVHCLQASPGATIYGCKASVARADARGVQLAAPQPSADGQRLPPGALAFR